MDNLAPAGMLWIVATFFAAGAVKGVIGMGLPTLAMGLLGAVLNPATAASLLVLPSFVSNLWQMAMGPGLKRLLVRLATLLTGIVLGTLAGIDGLTSAPRGVTLAMLGGALITYGAIGLTPLRPTISARTEPFLSPFIGVLTGLITGATGVFVIPSVLYLQALGFEKDELVQALGITFTVSTIALAVALFWAGSFEPAVGFWSAAALAPTLLGMAAGQWLRARISPGNFRVCFFIAILMLGAAMILQAF